MKATDFSVPACNSLIRLDEQTWTERSVPFISPFSATCLTSRYRITCNRYLVFDPFSLTRFSDFQNLKKRPGCVV